MPRRRVTQTELFDFAETGKDSSASERQTAPERRDDGPDRTERDRDRSSAREARTPVYVCVEGIRWLAAGLDQGEDGALRCRRCGGEARRA